MFRLVSQHEASADLKANGFVVEILKFKVPRSYPVERDDVFPSKLKLSVISEYYSHTHKEIETFSARTTPQNMTKHQLFFVF